MKKFLVLLLFVSVSSFAQDGLNIELGGALKPNKLMAGINYGYSIPNTKMIVSAGYQAPIFTDIAKGDVYVDGRYKLDSRWTVGGGVSSWVKDLGVLYPMVSATYLVKGSTTAFFNYSKYFVNVGVRVPLRIKVSRR